MESHASVAEMVFSYSEQAVKAAEGLSIKLDYSEGSVAELESVVGKVTPSEGDDMAEACKMWGSYLGEVVRRRFSGAWSIETYPGKQFATLTLSVGGSKIFPSMKVHRRLTQGESDNVWTFYKMVKARLEASPQAGAALIQ